MALPVSPTSKAAAAPAAAQPQSQPQSAVRLDRGFSESSLAAAPASRESSVAFDRAPSFSLQENRDKLSLLLQELIFLAS